MSTWKKLLASGAVACLVLWAYLAQGDTLAALFGLNITTTLKHISGGTTAQQDGKLRVSLAFHDGTATTSAQANMVYTIRGEVASSAITEYDLQSLTDAFGSAIVFSRIKAACIKNIDATDSLIIGSGTAPWAWDMATATRLTIGPMGLHAALCPYAGFDASTTNRIVYVSSSDLASYDLMIIGTQ